MKLYLSGKDAELVIESLEMMLMHGSVNNHDRAKQLLKRIERCKQLQKPHKPT